MFPSHLKSAASVSPYHTCPVVFWSLSTYKACITSGMWKPSDTTHSARPMGQPGYGCRLPLPGQLKIREELMGYHNNNNNNNNHNSVKLYLLTHSLTHSLTHTMQCCKMSLQTLNSRFIISAHEIVLLMAWPQPFHVSCLVSGSLINITQPNNAVKRLSQYIIVFSNSG